MSETPTKPYRRFRARGRPDEGGMDELRRLTERAQGSGGAASKAASKAASPPRPAQGAPPPRIPRADERARRRALHRVGRPWWSLRGLGPGGLLARGAMALAAVFLVWSVAGYIAVRGAVSESNDRVTANARAALTSAPGMLSNPTNILIVGSDARRGETRSRADTIMVMRLDPDSGTIRTLSIPRDMRIELGRLGQQKINAAYFYGHQAGIIRAVKRLTGLPVHHIVAVNFRGFPRAVDELGGVTVNNPTPLADCPYSGGRTVSFAGGEIDLDGERALEYVRVRQCDSDFERTRRQQAFLAALKSKLVSPGSAWKAPWKGASVVRTLSTDMGVNDLTKFAWLQWRLQQRPEDRYVYAGTTQNIGGVSYVIEEPTQAAEIIRRFVGD